MFEDYEVIIPTNFEKYRYISFKEILYKMM